MGQPADTRFYRPELDVVRFIAFLAVFFTHAVPLEGLGRNGMAAVRAGALGVPLFFCLSAYLITRLLLLERDRTGTVQLGRFYKRRMLRIWPLYLLALVVSAANSARHGTLNQTGIWYLLALAMLGNVAWWVHTTVMHLWSISLEEQFYLFWPAAVRRLSRRGLALLALGLILVANTTLVLYSLRHVQHDGRVWTNTFVQMEAFASGILLALWHAGVQRPEAPGWARPLLLTLVPACWFAAVRWCGMLGPVNVQVPGPLALPCGYALASLGCICMLVAVDGWSRWPRMLVYLGRISYGLYVFHGVALVGAGHLLLQYGMAYRITAALLLNVLAAALSYQFLERPFLLLKQRFEVVHSRPVNGEPVQPNASRTPVYEGLPATSNRARQPSQQQRWHRIVPSLPHGEDGYKHSVTSASSSCR